MTLNDWILAFLLGFVMAAASIAIALLVAFSWRSRSTKQEPKDA